MSRQNRIEDECFAPIHPDKPNLVDSDTISYGFDTAGKSCSVSSKNCVAKVVTDEVTKSAKYYVKARKGGKFFDPAISKDDVLDTVDKDLGEMLFNFKEVKSPSLTLYLDYIRTRSNNSSLLQAERE